MKIPSSGVNSFKCERGQHLLLSRIPIHPDDYPTIHYQLFIYQLINLLHMGMTLQLEVYSHRSTTSCHKCVRVDLPLCNTIFNVLNYAFCADIVFDNPGIKQVFTPYI